MRIEEILHRPLLATPELPFEIDEESGFDQALVHLACSGTPPPAPSAANDG